MLSERKYSLFIKVGEKEHMHSLFTKGEIYFNTIEYYRKAESNNLLSDPHEGISQLMQGNAKFNYEDIRFSSESVQIAITDNTLKGNIFCFLGLESRTIMPSKKFISLNTDLTSINWGDTVVVIYNTIEFIKRVERELNKQDYKYQISPVLYYDFKKYSGKLDIFKKRNEYEKQNEIRIFIENETCKPIKLSVGSIEDIALILDRSDFNKLKYDYK
jgi:hypothetical protein